jgi:DeoR/GlpR family transcriptional regulator of sugar metabolism
VTLLLDSAKFPGSGVARICGPESIDALVTDDAAPAAVVAELEREGVEVVRA